ncbi:MAG: threonine synthase [Terriglobia bacterium]|nr:threonine synthase [Terriglobia bacterium]
MAEIIHFECARCGEKISPAGPQNLCPKCQGPLYVRYDIKKISKTFRPESLAGREPTMWRYREVLPGAEPVTLGEGMTPMLPSRKHPAAFIKDEGLNPTGSFKARGMSAAITMVRHYGIKKVAVPSAGNAAGALAAYAARAGVEAYIFMPKDVPIANRMECEAYGAKVTLVDGLISDCGRIVAERKQAEGWFEVSTLKEPFRIEGKKTMGYEIAEQFGWKLPEAVIYPTGGGVGLIGMWKAFDEMQEMGWIGPERPKMISVQSTGCAPIVKAYDEGKATSEMWKDAATVASGLRVPKALGDFIVLDAVRKSGGGAVGVTDEEIMECFSEWARDEGVFAAPEGAASLAAYKKLRKSGFLRETDRTVMFNTGSGMKYFEAVAEYLNIPLPAAKKELPKSRNIGGIIQPV